MQLVDILRSLRTHWRASIGILLLSGVVLGLFLFTRSEVRDPDRFRSTAQVLVPVRGENGEIPEGVPAPLLFGQTALALSADTTGEALAAVGLDDSDRADVEFSYAASERGDIANLTVVAPRLDQSIALVQSFATAFTSARQDAVAEGAEGSRTATRRALSIYETRLREVEGEIRAADSTLLDVPTPSIDDQEEGEEGALPARPEVPAGTSIDATLLVYERAALLARIESTQRAFAQTSLDALVPQSYATVVDRLAPQQITPELPSPILPIAVAAGVGLLLALAVPVLLDRIDHTIRDPRTAGSALSAPVLSTIPASSLANRQTLARPGSERDAAYRTLAAAAIATDQLPRAIVVTAPVGLMQDSVAANFAAALAGLGLRVALIATEPRQAWFSNGEQAGSTLGGLLALANAGTLNGQVRQGLSPSPVANLRVLPPGDAETHAMLDGLPTVLDALADAEIDVTVIAGPAMLEEPAATILAWSTRSVLWVVESGAVTEHEAREAAARLALAGATPFGVALVDAQS